MLAVSIKLTKKKAATILFIIFALLCIAAVIFSMVKKSEEKVNYTAADAAGCVEFLKQFGWEVNPAPLKEEKIVIPAELDDVYKEYNEIQKAQGLDISLYTGKEVTHMQFEVTNYPGGMENIEANLLIYDSQVIAGDICNVRLNGFMHGFDLTGTGLAFGSGE
ncbi:MAG TPA: DUF4830 domain-containing protein [Firmicutes bacterium]|mgnify:CR=1 FL=1|nr:DUF4830 domain-containing protein [Bacillota bacterium]